MTAIVPNAPIRGAVRIKGGAEMRRPPRPRPSGVNEMSAPSVPVTVAIRPVSSVHGAALALLGTAIESLGSGQDDEAVHAARKDCKRIRAALRLLRGCLGSRIYRRENRRIRDAAKLLRPARDAFVLRELLRTLPRRPITLQRGLESEYRAQRRALDRQGARSALKRLSATRQNLLALPALHSETASVIAGARRVYKVGRKAHRKARRKHDAALHEWRKQAKYRLNQLELLKTVFNVKVTRLRRRAHKLAEALGDDHDLGMLIGKLRTYKARDRSVIKHIESRRCELQARAFRLGKRLYTHRAKHVAAALARRLSISNERRSGGGPRTT
jgi:CHAD domain-containing protein